MSRNIERGPEFRPPEDEKPEEALEKEILEEEELEGEGVPEKEKPEVVLEDEEPEEKKLEKEKEERSEKIEKLFGHCFEISKFENDDRIPVGGESFLSGEANIEVIGDFQNFKDWFEEMRDVASRISRNEKLMKWVDEETGIDRKLFASIGAFTKVFEQKYSRSSDTLSIRKKLYEEKRGEIKLSDVFNQNSAECAEIAALARYFLQQEGVDSRYFSGDALWNKDDEFSEEHSFIVIPHKGETYIFDPANPTDTTEGKFPSIYTIETDFEDEVRKGKKRFVAAKNILSKKGAYFGVNDGTYISEKDIVEK